MYTTFLVREKMNIYLRYLFSMWSSVYIWIILFIILVYISMFNGYQIFTEFYSFLKVIKNCFIISVKVGIA